MIRFRKDTPRYWFMSNYYSCEFVMNGIRYKNAEAAFQSHKVPLEERKQFSDIPSEQSLLLRREHHERVGRQRIHQGQRK